MNGQLTDRHLEALALVRKGLTVPQIAARLGIGERAVYKLLRAARDRMGVDAQPRRTKDGGALVDEHPFLAAYLREFDRWLASGRRSKSARDAMTIALWGHQVSRKEAA